MINFILVILRRNAYFLLAAAWLFTIGFIINNYFAGASSTPYFQRGLEERIKVQEQKVGEIASDTVLLKVLAEGTYREQQLEQLSKLDFSLFVYKPAAHESWNLAFWSDQQTEPNSDIIYSHDNNQLIKLSNGQYEYIRKLVPLARDTLLVVALVPIRKEYFIQNNNLKSQFVGYPNAENSINMVEVETEFPVHCTSGKILFYLQPKNIYASHSANEWAILVSVLGIVFLLIVIHNIANNISEKFGFATGLVFLVGTITVLRILTYFFKETLSWRAYELFDPSIYSSNVFLPTLGDLLINVFLLCWMLLFVYRKSDVVNLRPYSNHLIHWPIVAFGAFFMVVTTFSFAVVIKSLIADARISFNVTNIFSLDKYSILGFIVLATLALSYFLASSIIIKWLKPLMETNAFLFYAFLSGFGLLVITFIRTNNLVELNIFVLLWLLGYVWLMRQSILRSKDAIWSVSGLLLWIFLYSVSISLIIIGENSRIELERRKRTAEKLSQQADPTSSDKLLSIALAYFDNDFLYNNFNRFRFATSNKYLKDSLINKNFSAYLNKYDTRLYTFDASEKALYNEDPVSYDTLNTIYRIEGKPTNIVDMRYYEKGFDRFSYISRKMVTDSQGVAVGYMFIVSDPKKYKSDALVPELFRASKDFLPDEYSPIYSYAIYNNRELVDYFNNYAFPTRLSAMQVPRENFTQRQSYNYDELWYRDNDKVVIIARRDNLWLESITLVAYLFSTFLLLLGLFRLMSMLVESRLRLKNLKQAIQMNLRTQIHGTIIFISLFSFFVIGVATIFFFINRYNKNKQDQLSKAIQIMANEVQTKIDSKSFLEYMIKLYEEGYNELLENLVQEVSEIHGTDINIYDLNGELRLSSNPFIYDKGILSVRMNPRAYYKMHRQRLVQCTEEEQMGNISYQSIYSPVRDEKGNAYAYLNMPSFDSQEDLKKEISNFLVTIINLNAFIFLIAGVIALFITNRITSSFSLISEKMQAVNLGQHNDAIDWHREDEIGELVKEYNKMVMKLEESAAALAKSEREGAWREMARQVAHEIKNPLTPMKLSIQYLEKAIDNNTVDVKQLTRNVAHTLVEQIDHLSKIASEFSQFANISNVRNEVFDLHEILFSLSHLYESSEQVEFSWQPLNRKLMVDADRTQLNRLFTNLLQNAVEATVNNEAPVVSMEEEMNDNYIIVRIQDNGQGIPQTMQSKIFTPNFTTKTSGTGLGLAMSKGIVEQAKGRIWFETREGAETIFFVELPLSEELG